MRSLLKHTVVLAVTLAVHLTQAQQVELVPLQTLGSPEKPVNAVEQSTKPIQSLSVAGHWVALDTKNSISGFSISEITCVKAGIWGNHDGYCHERGKYRSKCRVPSNA